VIGEQNPVSETDRFTRRLADMERQIGDLQRTTQRRLGGAWNSTHIILGAYHLWIDATGRLRVKSSAPVSDTDGTVVGTQT
jgi:hypothetical protein